MLLYENELLNNLLAMKFLDAKLFANLSEILTKNEKIKIDFYVICSFFFGLMDVFSMILIGFTASNLVPIIQSKPQNISFFVKKIVDTLNNFVSVDYKTLFIFMIIFSLILLILKNVILRILQRRLQVFLASISNRFLKDFLKLYFSTPINNKQVYSKGELIRIFHLGVDSLFFQNLGLRIQIFNEMIGIIVLLIPIIVVFPLVSLLLIIVFLGTRTVFYTKILHKSEQLGTETETSVQKYSENLIYLMESESENFNKTNFDNLIQKGLGYRRSYIDAKVEKLLAQLMPRFILENLLIGLLIPISILLWVFLSVSTALLLLSLSFVFLLRVVPSISRILSYLVILRQHKTLALEITSQYLALKFTNDNCLSSNRFLNQGSNPSIIFENYSLISPKNIVLSEDKNLEMTGTGVFLLRGSNGSGKSSLLKSIVGQIQSTNGSIKISVHGKSKNLEDEIQFLPQHAAIFGNTISSNFDVGTNLSNDELNEAVSILDLLKFKQQTSKEISFGSGGEIQKVLIARTLSHKCSIFILDEPTNHLDKNSYLPLSEIIGAKSKNSLILIATHDVEFIDLLPVKATFYL